MLLTLLTHSRLTVQQLLINHSNCEPLKLDITSNSKELSTGKYMRVITYKRELYSFLIKY